MLNRITLSICIAGVLAALSGCGTQPMPDPVPVQLPDPPTVAGTPGDKFALWSSGVKLRGANIYQRRVYPEIDGPDFIGPGPIGAPFVQADFDKLAALGCNYVNISHPGVFTATPPYQADPDVVANLDKLLTMIAKADMFAVICFRSGPGRGEFSIFHDQDWYPKSLINQKIWSDSAAQDGWIAMWKFTAERYKNNPIVVGYDLMVEPNSNHVVANDFDPASFYANYANKTADWNQLYPRVSTAVRSVDADTPILIGGNSYSAASWLPYLKPTGDARTVYTVHHYEPMNYTHADPPLTLTYPGAFDADGDGNPDNVNANYLQNSLSPISTFRTATGAPVAVTECGIKRWEPGAATYMADQIAAQETYGVNWAVWLWTPAWEPAAVSDDFDFRHGPDPTKHVDVPANALLGAMKTAWAKNTVRPSKWLKP